MRRYPLSKIAAFYSMYLPSPHQHAHHLAIVSLFHSSDFPTTIQQSTIFIYSHSYMLCTSKGKPHSKDYLVSPYGNNSLQYLTVLNCTKRNSPFCLQNHFIWPNNAGPASTVT
ncbi:hypothetical protein NP493_116g05002 [Ridgeia piscesae]|uniref:Uncharacterized protein n=1 Tax=Ridgeia piscesae TaxID=27915 RepID=A0AAD9PGU8_RIDPI|nr:hypothetical protein NP493_116g05002 [Ridgeia piscesae]